MEYKELPKKNKKVDKDTIFQQYIDGNFYEWSEFARHFSYNPEYKNQFPFAEWQNKWLAHKATVFQKAYAPTHLEAQQSFSLSTLKTLKQVSDLKHKVLMVASKKIESVTENPLLASTYELGLLMKILNASIDTAPKEIAILSALNTISQSELSPLKEQSEDIESTTEEWSLTVQGGEMLSKNDWLNLFKQVVDRPDSQRPFNEDIDEP